MRRFGIFLFTVVLTLLLNVTASLYVEDLRPLVPYGWFAVTMYGTFLLATNKTIQGTVVRAMGGRNMLWGYTFAIVTGAALGGIYWYGIVSTTRRLGSHQHRRVEVPPKQDVVGLAPGRPSGGPLTRVEGVVPVPSWQQCRGLSDEEEIKCLCPRPLPFAMKRLPSPPDNNYSTEVTITTDREPMFRIRLYSRTVISRSVVKEAFPNDKNSVVSQLLMDNDKYSVVIISSAPQTRFTLVIDTAEALRLKCVNQEN